MISIKGMTLDMDKGTLVSASLDITTADGDEHSKRLFDLIAELFQMVQFGPRIEFDMNQSLPRVSYQKGAVAPSTAQLQ